MPNILVVGGSGYIGSAVCASLNRSGDHVVYGLSRSASSSKKLAINEVIPVPSDPQSYLSLIASTPIDVVVDVAGVQDSPLVQDVTKAGKDRLAAYQKAGIVGPKLAFVTVSGVWIYGSTKERVNEAVPVGANNLSKNPPAQMIAWRPQLEQSLLGARDVLDVAIVRPALAYGRESAIWGMIFGPILGAAASGSTDTVKISLDRGSTPAVCHVDDIGAGFHAAVDKVSVLGGAGAWPVFDLIGEVVNMEAIIEKAKDVLGFKGTIELTGAGENPFAQALSLSLNSRASRAKLLLGWEPKKTSFYGDLDVYVKAFAAAAQ